MYDITLLQCEDWGLSRRCSSNSLNEVSISHPVGSLDITGENEACNVQISTGGTWNYVLTQIEGQPLPQIDHNSGGKLELSFSGNTQPKLK